MKEPNAQPTPPRADYLPDPEPTGVVALQDQMQVLWRRKWLIASLSLLFLVLGGIQVRNTETLYASQAVIRYDPGSGPLNNLDGGDSRLRLSEQIQTQIEVMRSPRIVGRVIDSLGLGGNAIPAAQEPQGPMARLAAALGSAWMTVRTDVLGEQPQPLEPEEAARQRIEKAMTDNLVVQQVRDTQLISVTVYHPRARTAAAIADEFCNQYILSLLEDQTKRYRTAAGWLEEQLGQARDRVARAEQATFDYEAKSDIRVLRQNYEIAADTMKKLSQDVEAQKNQIAAFEAAGEAGTSPERLGVLLAENETYASLQKSMNELQLRRVALIAENTASHPDVIRLNRQITVLADQMTSASQILLGHRRAEEEIARVRLASLRERLAQQEEQVQAIQKELIEYRVLEREAESARQIFTTLLDQSKRVDISSQIDTTNVSVLSAAKVPEFPSSPRVLRTLLIFALLGFSFGCGLVLVVHKLDRSIKDPAEVEARLGLPTLGVVPHLKAGFFGRRKGGHALVANQPKSPEAEAFRVLRTSLQYSSAGRPPQVLLVSSCLPQEGKSTVALNIALSYAQRGARTLLIDADLKMPVVHKSFEIPRIPGLSDILTGQNEDDAAILASGHDNLDVMPAGHATPSPADLLESDPMRALVARLREKYQVVVIDSAPLTGMADTLVLTRVADGLCLVVSQGRTPADLLAKTVGALDNLSAHILGVIYNNRVKRSTLGRSAEGYGYYGMRYGYTSRAEKPE